MYASEFGQNTWDELNLIEPGRNYGWPVVEGTGRTLRVRRPPARSGRPPTPRRAASPWPTGRSGWQRCAVESLWRIPLSGNGVGTPQRLLEGRYGRLRDVVLAPDGRLWVLTSNTFRGNPAADDDRVVAIPLDDLADGPAPARPTARHGRLRAATCWSGGT